MLPLTEKYRPQKLDEIKGQETAIQELKNFLKIFPKKKALIITGPPGSGKTSMALALAKENNLELFELNASDLRNKEKLEEILKPAVLQQSLFNKGKIILMDEVDGISTADKGGLPELITLIDKANFPIIITANDIWDPKFSLLRKKCLVISLKELKEETILEILREILIKENKTLDEEILKAIAKRAKGDVRAALNDLQTYILSQDNELLSEDQIREKEESIFEILKKIFQYPINKDIINILDKTELNLDEIALWIEENIPLEYQGKSLAKAFDYLSKFDVFRGRIHRQQHWRFLVYENFFLTAGICSATKIKYRKFTQYQRPSRILSIWLANQKYQKKRSIISKFAHFNHMSKKKASKEFFLIPLIIDTEKEELLKKLDLNEEEIKYLKEKKEIILENIKSK